ncbi:MAG: hypothetical protein CVT63_05760 [Candidatus Anoxymicrobium japonicum]|uniref:DUF1156 domain-containing protein n=1 Tax=Candidatus Anoxymicrobium japonicum TaxID=2013648 RepID=A0A2N3G564_9ACTN|nr:MAG: hypothetical protein CVT63_05760 [Candidatus Anoxymicrobium japonicum]
MEYRRKLIEVALPLEAINKESAREKSIRHGHPSTMHLWWARRPLAACRAVLFASLVDDPSAWPELFPTEEDQEAERKRLFEIIEQLVKWENSNNETVLLMAQTEMARSISRNLGDAMPEGAEAIRKYLAEKAPPVLDPFCGGGSIPLEAQRLGLRAYGSDLNPVAVLITKALIEIPPKFAGLPPVNPEAREEKRLTEKEWKGAEGLADDVRYYGKWMRDEAEKRIGHFYPKVKVTKEMVKDRPDLEPYADQELTVIAWLWARTVPSPNPACKGAHVPLVQSFWLSTKKGKEAYVQPVVDREANTYSFEIHVGKPPEDFDPGKGTKAGRGASFNCIISGSPMTKDYVRGEFRAKRNSDILMAVVAEGNRSRVYLNPVESQERIARSTKPGWKPEIDMNTASKDLVSGRGYGITKWHELFTNRQLVALTTFSDLVQEAREQVLKDAISSVALPDDDRSIDADGIGKTAYADGVTTYLGLASSRSADYWATLATWETASGFVRGTFARQALPMVWDFCEGNPMGGASGDWSGAIGWTCRVLERLPSNLQGAARQLDATAALDGIETPVVSTDPPYYDNIGYADLSDFFYIWLRRALGRIYPQLFSTLLTPKTQELIASPYRHEGSKDKAKVFFEEGLGKTFMSMREAQNPSFPITVYYAFKQAETDGGDAGKNGVGSSKVTASTGWETMLAGLIHAGFSVHGTWPMRTERSTRSISLGANALASSIILVCRPRTDDSPLATRREFLSALKNELPDALKNLQHGNIAPVDLAQASIGPGMAVFTRYSKVMESDGSPMLVRTALGLINQMLDEVLAEQEGEFDADTRWAIAWFDQFGMEQGPFGVAETLSKAKNTAVNGLVDAGILEAKAGKVRLLKRDELMEDWDPARDKRFTGWEAAQYLIQALDQQGEQGAAALLRKLGGGHGETARDLSYRLYNICERKGWAREALAYNSLVIAWPEITRLAHAAAAEGYGPQTGLFENE